MPKRKRSTQDSSTQINAVPDAGTAANSIPIIPRPATAEESARSIAIQQKSVQQKIHHGKIILKRALKRAKGFEQQKLGKRIKASRNGKGSGGIEDVERLMGELEALKEIALAELAEAHLYKALLKNRTISTSPYLPPFITTSTTSDTKALGSPVAKMNVAARLYNSNPVKEAMLESLHSIRLIMGIEDTSSEKALDNSKNENTNNLKDKTMKKKQELTQQFPGVEEDISGSDGDDESEFLDSDSDDGIDKANAVMALEKSNQINGDAVSDATSDEHSGDDRIALSDVDSDDDGGVQLNTSRGRSMSITPISDISDAEISRSPSLEPVATKPKSKIKSSFDDMPLAPPKASAFLPSLMSGYISGSSLSSDSDNGRKSKKTKGPPTKKIRKNRMGQQARRALAERKFGKEAKHIQAEELAREEKKRQKEKKQKAWTERQEKPVHPSWEAKRSAKDERAQVVKDMLKKTSDKAGKSGPVVSLGKKIVFD